MSLRRKLEPLVRHLPVPILAGPNKGLRWSFGSVGRGYGGGTFEADRMRAITALLQPEDTFWDVGAHRGYVTLLAARRIGPKGIVYSFEPSPANFPYLEKHVQWNPSPQLTIFNFALSDFDGVSSFGGPGSISSHLGGGTDQVQVRSVASLIASGECRPPTFLKIDAEGAEAHILNGMGAFLDGPNMAITLGTHSREVHEECLAILAAHGYTVIASGSVAEAYKRGWEAFGDVDVLAIGPGRVVSEETVALFRKL